MKERMTGPVAWIIVLILVVPFAFFGIEQFGSGGGDPAIAEVGGEEITQSQFQQAYQQQYQRLAQMLGENFRPEMVNNDAFRMRVLEDLVQERVLSRYAREQGYGTSDTDLMAYLRKTPAFQKDGSFSPETYRAMLARVGQTPERYEAMLSKALAIEQMRDGVLDSSFISDREFERAYGLQNQTRALRYLRFPVSKYEGQVDISDAEVQARYEADATRYQAPERIKLSYIELDRDRLPPAQTPHSDVLKLIYESEKDTRFSEPQERLVRHILINFGADRDASRREIEALREQIQGGADFAEVARARSDDPSSRDDGGSLGWVREGQFDEAFEKAVFSLEQGQLSQPVESAFGWHLIEVDEIRAARTRPFDDPEVQSELVQLYNSREASTRFEDYAEQIEDQAFQNAESLRAAADVAGLEIKTTDWLTRTAQNGIMAYDAVREAAFSDEVLGGENSKLLSVSPTRIMVIRKQAYEPARRRELNEVAEQIRGQLRTEAARRKAADAAAAAMAAARGDRTLDAIAAEQKLEVEAPGMVTRDQTDVPVAVLDTLFKMPRPAEGRPSFEAVRLSDGDSALIALDGVAEPSSAAADAQTREAARQRLRASAAGAEFTGVVESIRRAANVEIKQAPTQTASWE